MSPYSSAHQGSYIVRQGGVCTHNRAITRESLRYYLGNTPYHSHGPWLHDDDRTECPDGPAKEFGPQ
jgi:hypothetical protein